MTHLGGVIGVAALCLVLATLATAEQPRDSIADLDALAAQHSWQELSDHLMDIPPAARDAHWQALVEQAAIGELTPYAASNASADKLDLIERYYAAFPTLSRSLHL